MASNAQVAAQVLRSCAGFFDSIGDQNPSLKEQMDTNSKTCAAIAELVEGDPTGESPMAELPADEPDQG